MGALNLLRISQSKKVFKVENNYEIISRSNLLFRKIMKNKIKVCALNYRQQNYSSFGEWSNHLVSFIDVASENGCDFVVFPEFVTMPLLTLDKKKLDSEKSLEKLTSYTEQYIHLLKHEAKSKNINIIGGTHLMKTSIGEIKNVCHIFLRDGSVHTQEKIHITPSEREAWKVKGGNQSKIIETDCGPIGILVCYDGQFPELSRHLMNQGANILFVPYSTDTRHGHLRVRICSHARTIENQCYVVLSGNTGHLKNVFNADISYAQSCILTPSDFPFDRDGIAAETEANVEMVIMAELDLKKLIDVRENGSVQNLKDRRLDLYKIQWENPKN